MSLSLEPAQWLLALLFAAVAWLCWRSHRLLRGCFWMTLALLFVTAPILPSAWIGGGVLLASALAFAANSERLNEAEAKELEAQSAEHSVKWGAKLLQPAIALPVVTVVLTLLLREALARNWLVYSAPDAPLYALTIGAAGVLMTACWAMRVAPQSAALNGARTLDQIGWPVILPMLLAILGAIYAKSGVGDALASHLTGVFPTDNRYACLLLFAISMPLLTMLLGNAFAAFPVIMAAVGIPLVVRLHHGDPLVLASIGMLCGYCGTLMTPLAANFNLVPAVLLELEDRNAVIRAQIPTALWLLAANVALLSALVFR